jgi:hypothetical protein
VALPEPVPGLVVRYSYLWHREYVEGRDEGQKDRPCAIVAALRVDENGDTRVLALPITHTPPLVPDLAVEIPAKVKDRLRLDHARSWVVLSEWNAFVWPGPDLRRLPGATDASVAYGMLPPNLFLAIRERFLAIVKAHGAHEVRRT